MTSPTTCFLTCMNYTSGGEVVLLSHQVVEDGGCHLVADHPWPTEKLRAMGVGGGRWTWEAEEGHELVSEKQRRSLLLSCTVARGVIGGCENRSDSLHWSDALHRGTAIMYWAASIAWPWNYYQFVFFYQFFIWNRLYTCCCVGISKFLSLIYYFLYK
jgi:hypothetical protein